MFKEIAGWLLKRHSKTNTEEKKVKCKNCGLYIAPSQVENHEQLCIAEKPVDSAELNEEFVSMATINRLDLTTLNIELQLMLSTDIISDIVENFIHYPDFHKFLKETIYSRSFCEFI